MKTFPICAGLAGAPALPERCDPGKSSLARVPAQSLPGTPCFIRFFENGVISLHLPISAHALGSRATRSTHPRVLDGLTKLFSQLLGEPFEVDNPFFWKTKADIVESIVRHGHGDLIAYTRSCANTRDQTKIHPHCGCCSQCIDRRFSTLAAAPDCLDPDTDYRIDLLQGPRDPYEQISMLASYVSTVSKIEMMTDRAFFSAFGEAARVYSISAIHRPQQARRYSSYTSVMRSAYAECWIRKLLRTPRLYARTRCPLAAF